MKKVLLAGMVGLLSINFANAQWQTAGAHDDFASATEYANGPNGEGLFWFELTGGDTLALTRAGDGLLNIAATTAGGCSSPNPKCYPTFGVNFGNDGGTPLTVDLSGGADIVLDLETDIDELSYMSITLVDINDKSSKFEPNVSDLTPSSTWDDPERKSLNGFTFTDASRRTITIDLSSVPGAIGGLSQNGAYNCAPGPYNCPPTSYQINAAKIKAILFTVNAGADDIFISEGSEDGDYTNDTYIPGVDISPVTGNYKLHDFKIGNFIATSTKDAAVEGSLSVFPNPAKDAFTVAFEGTSTSEVSLSDVFGNKVYSTTAATGTNAIKVETATLANGIYILNIVSENGKVSRKVTVQ